MEKPSVLVIGAGVGGIATAAYLARHGYPVTVVEKCDQAGGRCSQVVIEDHHFVTGPSLFLMPKIYAQSFTDLGERMEDHLDLRRVDPGYRIHFEDGLSLSLTSDLHSMKTQLEAIEPGSFRGFLQLLQEGYIHYTLSLPYLVERNFHNLVEYCNSKNIQLLFKLKMLRKQYANIGNYFHDPRLKAAFTFQSIYIGLSPFKAPAIYSLLQYTEFADGIWSPKGGMYRIIEALTSIAENWGVHFEYGIPVEKIQTNDHKVAGAMLTDGRFIHADVMVANADLPYVYRHLLPNDGIVNRLERKSYSCSAVIFYWGLDKLYPQLGPHNLFISGDYRQSFDEIFKDHTIPSNPSFYVHAPARMDPTLVPKGHDSLMIILPVGHMNENASKDWTFIQSRARRVVLKRLAEMGAHDLEKHLKFERSFSPPDWQNQFNLAKGSTHGLSHTLMQMGYLRPHNRHAHYHNLYFVGASTHPGTGLPTVLVSARLAAERILQDTLHK